MHSIIKYFLFVFLFVLNENGYAQIFGGNPPSLKWNQINTPEARVIFPFQLDSTAQRLINIIEYINRPMQNTIGKKSRKINLVLQNQTTISNAYVGLGPFRSEFLTTSLQNSFELGSLPWPDQLTIHEFRHVQQYNNFNVGLSKIMFDIFGEEGQALANNAVIPNWFFEGDAVFNETNVSLQGRGRLPYFYNGYRALWMEGKNYSWMKLRNGSLKDFVPNHYPLGFLMVSYGRQQYGDTFWEKVTHDAASFKGLLYPFQRAIKKYSGKDYVTFRNDALQYFIKQFDLEKIAPEINKKHKDYLDEVFPVFLGKDSILFVHSGFKQIPEFVIKAGGNMHKIRTLDYAIDNHFSYRNGKIVYAAYQPDVRWGYRDFSDLRILDISNGKQQTLTRHTKYFAPDISEDGKKVITVDETTNNKCYLKLLDASTGKVLQQVPNPGNLFYTYPKFYSNTAIISAVRNPKGQMSLALINLQNGNSNFLTPFSYNVIGFPFIKNDTVYFSGSFGKNDELFAYTFPDKKLWIITYDQKGGTGKYQPAVNDASFLWSTFTAEGFKLKDVPKKEVHFWEISPDDFKNDTTDFGITVLQQTNENLLSGVPADTFAISKYKKGFKLINFHSIEPQASDPDYSINLLSENILNTFQSQFSFTYDRAEKYKQVGFSGIYGSFFPYLSAGVNYTFNRRTLFRGNQVLFNEFEPYAGLNFPLNLSKGRSFTNLNFGSQYVYNQSDFKGAYKDTLGKISYGYASNFINFSHQVQQAIQQVLPRFAQTIGLTYKAPVSKYKGFQFVANANIYLPGLYTTHGIILNGAFLKKDTLGQINFSSGFPFSRGYSAINLFKMYKWGIDYALPLLYPDKGVGEILYVLRVRGDLFYDNTYVNDFYPNGNKFAAYFSSAGMEIYFDTKWWNEANVSFGIRYSRLFDPDLFGGTGSNRWEFILPVNIFNQ